MSWRLEHRRHLQQTTTCSSALAYNIKDLHTTLDVLLVKSILDIRCWIFVQSRYYPHPHDDQALCTSALTCIASAWNQTSIFGKDISNGLEQAVTRKLADWWYLPCIHRTLSAVQETHISSLYIYVCYVCITKRVYTFSLCFSTVIQVLIA